MMVHLVVRCHLIIALVFCELCHVPVVASTRSRYVGRIKGGSKSSNDPNRQLTEPVTKPGPKKHAGNLLGALDQVVSLNGAIRCLFISFLYQYHFFLTSISFAGIFHGKVERCFIGEDNSQNNN
jgi:hypothetical protein